MKNCSKREYICKIRIGLSLQYTSAHCMRTVISCSYISGQVVWFIKTALEKADLAQGLQISEPEEYEHPPFVENAALRLWYNEQPDRYMTHWHNATEMIVALENCYTVTVQNQIFHLQPGDILVVPPGALHSIQGNPKGEGSRFIFLFELTIFNSMYDFRFVRSA